MWPAVAAIVGSQIVSNMMGNEAASANASQNRNWQGDQERSAREFTERMSSTAHQREVEDLKKAGLNPILSANTGASTPSASAPSGAVAETKSPLEGVPQAALQAMQVKQQMSKTNAEISATNQQTDTSRAQAALYKSQDENTQMDTLVKSKGIPEAKVKNQLFQKLQESMNANAKSRPLSEQLEERSKAQDQINSENDYNYQLRIMRKLRGKK